MISGTV